MIPNHTTSVQYPFEMVQWVSRQHIDLLLNFGFRLSLRHKIRKDANCLLDLFVSRLQCR